MRYLNPPEVDKSARRTRQTNGGQAADKFRLPIVAGK